MAGVGPENQESLLSHGPLAAKERVVGGECKARGKRLFPGSGHLVMQIAENL